MIFTILWTIMLCVGIGFCILIRKYVNLILFFHIFIQLVHALHLVVRDANELSLKHNVLIGIQDRGQISCHKIVIVLMFYNPEECIADIKKLIRVHKANQPIKVEMPSEEELEANARDILLAHTQPYAKAYAKKQLVFPTKPSEGVSEFRPKHCSSSICLCQFVEKVRSTFNFKLHHLESFSKHAFNFWIRNHQVFIFTTQLTIGILFIICC